MKSYLSKLGVLLFGVMFAVAGCQDYDEDIRKVNDRLDENTKELTTITEELDAAIAALEDLAATHATKDELKAAKDDVLKALADAQASIKAAYEAADAALKGQITTDLEGKIAAAKTALEKTISALDSRVGTLETYVSGELKTALENLKKADTANANEIAKVAGELAKAKTDITAEIARVEGLVNAAVKRIEANEGNIQTILSDLEQAKKDILANAEGVDANKKAIDALKKAYEAKVAELEGKIAANVTAIAAEKTARETADTKLREDFAAADAALKAELEKAIKANTDKIGKNETAIKDLQSKMAELEGEIDSLSQLVNDNFETLVSHIIDLDFRLNVVESYVTDLMTRLAEVEVDVEALLARVQKIVYLPKYSDGKATINYALLGTDVVESQSEISYKVYPAELAAEIAEAYKSLRFDLLTDVTTRASEPALNIVAAKAADGVLTLTVQPRGLASEFYLEPGVSGKQSYSAALVLDNGNDNYSTEYANLWPVQKGNISFDLYDAKGGVINGFQMTIPSSIEIPYTQTDKKVVILADHYLRFTDGESKDLTYQQILDMGYALDLKVTYSKGTLPAGGAEKYLVCENVLNEKTALEEMVVSLDPEKVSPASVGTVAGYVYTYSLGSLKRWGGQMITIVKEPLEFVLPSQEVSWEYLADAKADADLYNKVNPVVNTYNRTFAALESEVNNPESGIALGDLKDVQATSISVMEVDGDKETIVQNPDVKIVFDDAKDQATVTYNNFAWDKTYNVTAVYALKSSDVTVKFSFTTKDRNRAAVYYTAETIKYAYEKDLVVDYTKTDAPVYSLATLYDLLQEAGNFGYAEMNEANAKATKAEYLKDINVLENGISWGDMNFVNDLDEQRVPKNNWTSMIYTDADLLAKEQYKVGYTWRTNSLHFKSDVVVKNFKYSKMFTTWYGQMVLVYQPVELTNPAAAYNYKPSGIHVSMDGEIPYSYANGVYTNANGDIINEGAVHSFRVDAVDMDKAFSVVEGENQEIVADLAKVGLVSVFTLENNTDENIKIENNKINYQGDAEYVDVIGKLYIENSADPGNGKVSRFEIENTLFASEPYASYQVRKWDPIMPEFTAIYKQPKELTIVESKKYTYDLLKNFSLKDKFAGSELINPNADVPAWVIGNDKNGFAKDRNVADIYGLVPSFKYDVDTDDNTILNAISEENGVLTIDNEGQLIVLNPVTITVTVTIKYPQGERTQTMQFVIPSRDPSKK